MQALVVRLVLVAALVQIAGCVPLRIQDTPRVQGVIADATTNQPVQGARVYFDQFPDHGALSGADGTFILPAIVNWHGVPVIGVGDRNLSGSLARGLSLVPQL